MKLLRTWPKTAGFLLMLPIFGIIGWTIYSKLTGHGGFTPPPDSVTTAKAEKQSWKKTYSAVGSLAPVNGATLSTEVIGRVAKINVQNGEDVPAGKVLVEMDTSVELANLADAEAWQERSRRRVERYHEVRESKVLSPDTVDDAHMDYQRSTATVNSLKATIERKNITAPFAGTVGIRLVNVGQILLPATPVIPLHNLDQLYVNFTLPQQALPNLRLGSAVIATLDTFPGETFTGKLTAIDPNVSETSRNINVQGLIENKDKKLRPGMFASIVLELPESSDYVVIPLTSISYAPYGDSVYVLTQLKDPANKDYTGVAQKIIQVGPRRGDFVAILSGLNEGDEVATTGVFKLHQGSSVAVNNDLKPSFSLSPKPSDS